MPRERSNGMVGAPSGIGSFTGRRAHSSFSSAHADGAIGINAQAQRERFWRTVLDDSHIDNGSRRPSPHVGVRCGECGAMFRGAAELSSHFEYKHRQQPRAFGCDRCGSQFSHRSQLSQHSCVSQDRKRPFKCDSCSSSFGKRFDLVSHYSAVHLNNRPHICPVTGCTSTFAKRSNLGRHITKLHPGHPPLAPCRASSRSAASTAEPAKRPRFGR